MKDSDDIQGLGFKGILQGGVGRVGCGEKGAFGFRRIDNLGLSLDLAFALDKTMAARRGPTPTFTRASTANFVGSDGLIQSAAVNAPRFDHDPVTLACKGLLIEESRENRNLRSQELDNAYYSTFNSSVTANNTTAPDGTITAEKIVENTSGGFHSIFLPVGISITAGQTFTRSAFLKADGRNFAILQITDNAVAYRAFFDLVTGVVGTVASGITATISDFGNGWYRCSITRTYVSNNSGSIPIELALSDGVATYVGGGTSGVFAWGLQFEAGSFPTSYIPTTTAALTRSADVCGPMLLGGSFINQLEGTMVIEFTRESIGSTSLIRSPLRVWSSGQVNDYAGIDYNDSVIRGPLRTNNATVFASSVQDTVFGSRKIASSWKSGGSNLVIDGEVRVTNLAAFSFPTPLDTLGFAQIISASYNGRIARIQYYRKRLPNAKLQTLTT